MPSLKLGSVAQFVVTGSLFSQVALMVAGSWGFVGGWQNEVGFGAHFPPQMLFPGLIC